MTYHIYWNERALFLDLSEDEFVFIWSKIRWVYNDELTYVQFDAADLHDTLAEASFQDNEHPQLAT